MQILSTLRIKIANLTIYNSLITIIFFLYSQYLLIVMLTKLKNIQSKKKKIKKHVYNQDISGN